MMIVIKRQCYSIFDDCWDITIINEHFCPLEEENVLRDNILSASTTQRELCEVKETFFFLQNKADLVYLKFQHYILFNIFHF